eukprot:CAMPEP_0172514422 /NCGR_PEP_ID=MMETSP1066-20121228/259951_1 /TAXON_ID=671091 /ORGANISM="Coscinodiscus wailesii, Strain CCMP2513" /LENGTH=138 /DNA_ID=CAMNT_0013295077 /DNA_START=336 /DNA_END=752 /DNA_ORIENTATION=+
MAKIDASKYRKTGSRFEVRGFPTLIYFADRKMYKYTGNRDVESLFEFATNGYKTQEGLVVPKPPSFIEEMVNDIRKTFRDSDMSIQVKMLKDDFNHIIDLRKNAAVALLAIGVLLGLISGCMLSCLMGGRKQKKIKTV